MKPRAITGFGVVSPIGIGRREFFEQLSVAPLVTERTPAPIEAFDASAYPDAIVIEVPSFDAKKYLGDKGLRTLDRLTKLLVVAARQCLHDAGFKKEGEFVQSSPDRIGFVCSNAYGSLETITELNRVAQLEDARYINPAKFPNTVANSASGYASIWENLRALNVSISDGNCGALDAFACADVFLDTDRADAILVGGAESMSEALYLAFRRLGALAGDMRLGEGATLFSLESPEHAQMRAAEVDGYLLGYGTAFGAPESETPLIHPSSDAMASALTAAIADAGLDPSAIDIAVTGLSGLGPFDDAERKAIAQVLGDVPLLAPKSLIGEALGAGGALGVAAALGWLSGHPISTHVGGPTPKAAPKTAVVTAIGYYGNASAVVIGAPDRGGAS